MNFRFLLLVTITLLDHSVVNASEKFDYRAFIELQLIHNDSIKSWNEGGFSKLRYDEGSFPGQFGKAGLHLDYRATDTLWLRTMTTLYIDSGLEAEFIEGFLNYRPVPKGPMRFRAKLGVFHLPGSLENRGISWTSIYSNTPSVINTWTGEEIRVTGAELLFSWPGRFRQSVHDFSLGAGVFGWNDGAGTVLAYRGWSNHDRQTGFGEELRLPDLVPGQAREFEPLKEIDDRPGYYVTGTWGYKQSLELSLMRYDNRAEAAANRDHQNAWRTEFQQVSLTWELPQNLKVLGQYMWGNTRADIRASGLYSDVDFSSGYLMLTRLINKHRFSIRYETFDIDDFDTFKSPLHNSNEKGHSWMAAYRYDFDQNWLLTAEWLNIYSKRDDRKGREGIPSESEHQILFSISYRF